jgi:fatty acid amide hydrolase
MTLPPATPSALLPAHALAAQLASGALSAVDAVEACIERLVAHRDRNLLVVERFDQARAEARAADRRRLAGEPLPPLHGVPITLKECLDLEGTPSTFGLPSRSAHRAPADAPAVRRLRDAGAIVLGKTNVAQLLLFYESDNPLYGRTDHPTHPDRSPGGSSGGEAVAVAVGGSALGFGTDVGGSCRAPAASCGLVGFKPTAGRCEDPGRYSVPYGQRAIASQVGVLARHPADVALALPILDASDRPLGDATSVRGLRVGVWDEGGAFEPCPAARRAVREVADALAADGVPVTRFVPPGLDRAVDLFYGILAADGGAHFGRILGRDRRDPRIALIESAASAGPAKLGLLRLLLRLTGRTGTLPIVAAYGDRSADRLLQRIERLLDWREEVLAALDRAGVDVVLSPALPLPALRHGASAELGTLGVWLALYNLLGWPAGVVPWTRVRPGEESDRVGRSYEDRVAVETERGSAGLPVGVQLAGRPWRDGSVLAAMGAVAERARLA